MRKTSFPAERNQAKRREGQKETSKERRKNRKPKEKENERGRAQERREKRFRRAGSKEHRAPPDGDEIDSLIARLVPRYAQARTNVRVELEFLAQREIERAEALSYRRGHWPFQTYAIPLHK